MEEWRDVVDYEGLYMVSNCGRVKSLNYNHTGKEEVLKENTNKKGYKIIYLYKNGKRQKYKIHRFVAKAFIPNANNFPEVNHKDEDKTNNKVDNLEWCTAEYNINYGTRNEKLSKKIKCITTNEIFNSIKEAKEKYNINYGSICSCCKGRYKFAGKHPITGEKLVWEYYEEVMFNGEKEKEI